MSQQTKWVYLFNEGDQSMRNLLGGKGAGVAEMTRSGMPVPPGFTITTDACRAYFEGQGRFPDGLEGQIDAALQAVEGESGKLFGDPANPLLVSVRSGARVSMPGMMDTVLNLGLSQATLKGLEERSGQSRFAYDSYRRFVQGYGSIVLGLESRRFEHVIQGHKDRLGKSEDSELSADEWNAVADEFKQLIEAETGSAFPEDPRDQLYGAIRAVFDSWHGKRAVDYRNFHGLPHDWGTAVNVQTMVFGNMGENSGTGVAFTRNSVSGDHELFGEYLLNAQGEDVVAGVRTPAQIATLADQLPEVYAQFEANAERLERHYRDMQDLEFTIEEGRLWMLQTRAGKRSPRAAVKIAVDMADEGIIDRATALARVEPAQVDAHLHPQVDPTVAVDPVATGLNASPGAAVGRVVFDADEAAERGRAGEDVILVRPETSPDDFHGMAVARAILTARGGATSHAAIVARALGLPAVVGCEQLRIDLDAGHVRIGSTQIDAGDTITVDGSTGNVILDEAPLIPGQITPELETLLSWADDQRRLQVWTNADTPQEAAQAREFGAQGIGLCRTEHMFREEDRLPIFQDMILAETEADRRSALARLLPIQRADFYGILKAMAALPVVIRLLDPPLHEFLSGVEEELEELRASGAPATELAAAERKVRRVGDLHEENPMLGLRGCRLGIVYPEIYEMQVRAIVEAAIQLEEEGVDAHPEIMIPLIGHINELRTVEANLRKTAEAVARERGRSPSYKFGTMMEVPRACLTASAIAEVAEFFSYGTNDLTQTTYGISRDDAEGKFLLQYVEDQILPRNPFQVLDAIGVGELMRLGSNAGRAVRPDIEIGICGEHGGDPESIAFCEEIGLDYVSCSPYRVPVARLAAAQAVGVDLTRDV
jgi:pyruvate,orthophosphate dikinase